MRSPEDQIFSSNSSSSKQDVVTNATTTTPQSLIVTTGARRHLLELSLTTTPVIGLLVTQISLPIRGGRGGSGTVRAPRWRGK